LTFEVVLVDNGSTDGSLDFVREHHLWVKLVELPGNRGFAVSNNIGLNHSNGAYLVTLNNDTAADSGWLAELVAVADARPEARMLASCICAFDEHDRSDSVSVGQRLFIV